MSDNTLIADGKVVSFHYTLTDPDGDTIDSSDGGEPMLYLVGAQNIVPGLERQMLGKTVGDELVAKVPFAEGYGPRDPNGAQDVPRESFPPDVELEAGMQFMGQTDDGGHFPLWIMGESDGVVTIDSNHPLAGVDLSFAVSITAIRDASEEEVAHGHPHGPGGHHHH